MPTSAGKNGATVTPNPIGECVTWTGHIPGIDLRMTGTQNWTQIGLQCLGVDEP